MKCHQNLNVTITEMSPKTECHQNQNVIKIEMLPKLKCNNLNMTVKVRVMTGIVLYTNEIFQFKYRRLSPIVGSLKQTSPLTVTFATAGKAPPFLTDPV